MGIHRIAADGITVALDDSVGHLALFEVEHDGRKLTPLHRAPWVDDPAQLFPAATPENVKRLSGDFLCAPFGRNDIEAGPTHGAPANTSWTLMDVRPTGNGAQATFRLDAAVMGARVEKIWQLVDGHPFLYQEHRFIGGSGAISAAHHVMVRMEAGGDIAYSPKLFARTPPDPLETDPARGGHLLAYPAETADLGAFPLDGGGTTDLRRYPPGQGHEDFLTLAEEPRNPLGWTVVSRHAEQDRVIVLRNPACLPVTMLWMSNGGRNYAPWSARHAGVLGIEDGRASPLGHRDSLADNAFTRRGIETAFSLMPDRVIVIRHMIGACPAALGEGRVAGLESGSGSLALHFDKGPARRMAWDEKFLALEMR